MNKHQELSRAAALLGKKGGQKGGLARVKKGFAMGDPSAAGKKGMLSRWNKRTVEVMTEVKNGSTDNQASGRKGRRRGGNAS